MKRIQVFMIIWILLWLTNIPIGAAEQMGRIVIETDSSELTQEMMAVYCIAEAQVEGPKWTYHWKEEFGMEGIEPERWVAGFSEKDMEEIEEKAEEIKPLQIKSFDLLKQWDKKEAMVQSILAIVPEMNVDRRTWNYERRYNAKYTLEPLIPQTGDSQERICVWIVTAAVSMAAVLGFVPIYKKNEKNIDRR